MSIKITGMYSGLDTESIISELVSAQSFKKNSLVKAQTKLSWKQDAWKALNTKIYSFYTNTLSNMRYQATYMKKTTKLSNSSAIKVVTSDDAVDGVRTVKVNKLAKGAYLTGADLSDNAGGVNFTGAADLATLRKYGKLNNDATLSGSFSVVGANGAEIKFEVNEKTTINDVVKMIQSTGLNANYDADSQRIFISSKSTGAINNFNLVANDEGGMNALAALGLLSKEDLASAENQKWARYGTDEGKADYEQLIKDEVARRQAAYEETNKKLAEQNESLGKTNDELAEENKTLLEALADDDYIGAKFAEKYPGQTFSGLLNDLFGEDGKFDEFKKARDEYLALSDREDDDEEKIAAKEAFENAQKAYEDAKAQAMDFLNDICYGPLEKVQETDENGELIYEEDGSTPVYKKELDEEGNPKLDDEGNEIYVQKRNGSLGLEEEYKAAQKAGEVDDELQAKVDALNKWYNALTTVEKNKANIADNADKIAANEKTIEKNEQYYIDGEEEEEGAAAGRVEAMVRAEFDAKVATAQDALEAAEGKGKYGNLLGASKVEAQDAEIEINGAKFTSMNNTFNVNGLTLTALEETDKEITMTTATDTDGIYDMIKNFFTEYNKLINEMDALYNAEDAKGYDPLLSEEKAELSDTEVEEWEKKIKDSLLRRDTTLSSISFDMASMLMQGATVNGKKMYLSDFGINTLGYFNAAENEKNAYHIDGDPDDENTKGNEDVLKKMLASDPETVRDFFVTLTNNLYDKLTDRMASSSMSSAFTVYNDKQMKSEINSYTDKIAKQEEKLNALMDKWYSKFSKMETAMSKLQSRSGSLTSLFGG